MYIYKAELAVVTCMQKCNVHFLKTCTSHSAITEATLYVILYVTIGLSLLVPLIVAFKELIVLDMLFSSLIVWFHTCIECFLIKKLYKV